MPKTSYTLARALSAASQLCEEFEGLEGEPDGVGQPAGADTAGEVRAEAVVNTAEEAVAAGESGAPAG